MKPIRHTLITLRMIKIEHSVFALPFALLGALLAQDGFPPAGVVFWIIVAMVSARSAAMAFNRLVDREYDAINPRTRNRALPSGLLTPGFVRAFVVVCSAVFFISAARLNPLAFTLSPIALFSILLYSYAKRFTAYTHVLLGWCLAISPTGAWIAVTGSLDSGIPLWLSLGVLTWTAGFDILYSCQDVDFDRAVGLHSLPQRYGVPLALWVARSLHLIAFVSFLIVALVAGLRFLGTIGVLAAGGLLIRQHSLVKPPDLSRINQAFFTTNAFLSVILLLTMGSEILLRAG